MANRIFNVRDGNVEVSTGRQIEWTGRVLGVSALAAFPLPGSEDGIVVLDWMDRPTGLEAWHPYRNLVRITSTGKIVWRAELPQGEMSFTEAHWEGGLLAFGWEHRCRLDPETGLVIEAIFTK